MESECCRCAWKSKDEVETTRSDILHCVQKQLVRQRDLFEVMSSAGTKSNDGREDRGNHSACIIKIIINIFAFPHHNQSYCSPNAKPSNRIAIDPVQKEKSSKL